MSMSDYLEKEVLDHVVGAAVYTAPTTLYIALFTAAPSDSGGGTEVTGGSYARAASTNNATEWPAATGTTPTLKTNANAISFTTPTGSWGLVTHFAIFDAVTAGNMLFWAALTASETINSGNPVSFPAGDIDINLD